MRIRSDSGSIAKVAVSKKNMYELRYPKQRCMLLSKLKMSIFLFKTKFNVNRDGKLSLWRNVLF